MKWSDSIPQYYGNFWRLSLSLPTTKSFVKVGFTLVFAAVRREEPSHVPEAHQVWELAPWGSLRGQQSHRLLPAPHHCGLWESVHVSQAWEPQREVRRGDLGISELGFWSRCLEEMLNVSRSEVSVLMWAEEEMAACLDAVWRDLIFWCCTEAMWRLLVVLLQGQLLCGVSCWLL